MRAPMKIHLQTNVDTQIRRHLHKHMHKIAQKLIPSTFYLATLKDLRVYIRTILFMRCLYGGIIDLGARQKVHTAWMTFCGYLFTQIQNIRFVNNSFDLADSCVIHLYPSCDTLLIYPLMAGFFPLNKKMERDHAHSRILWVIWKI